MINQKVKKNLIEAAYFGANTVKRGAEFVRLKTTRAGQFEEAISNEMTRRTADAAESKEVVEREIAERYLTDYLKNLENEQFPNPLDDNELLRVFVLFRTLFGKEFLAQSVKRGKEASKDPAKRREINLDQSQINQRVDGAKLLYEEIAEGIYGSEFPVSGGVVRDSATILERLRLRLQNLQQDIAYSTGDLKTTIEGTPNAQADIGLVLLYAERMRQHLKEFKSDVAWQKRWDQYFKDLSQSFKSESFKNNYAVVKLFKLVTKVAWHGSKLALLGSIRMPQKIARSIRNINNRGMQ